MSQNRVISCNEVRGFLTDVVRGVKLFLHDGIGLLAHLSLQIPRGPGTIACFVDSRDGPSKVHPCRSGLNQLVCTLTQYFPSLVETLLICPPCRQDQPVSTHDTNQWRPSDFH